MIRCQSLRWGAPGQPLTPAVDFELPKGSLTGVIGANGSLTGYGGGLDAKRWLISHEAGHVGLFA